MRPPQRSPGRTRVPALRLPQGAVFACGPVSECGPLYECGGVAGGGARGCGDGRGRDGPSDGGARGARQ